MSHYVYEYLADTFILHIEHIKENYRRFTDDEITQLLQDYREYSLNLLNSQSLTIASSEESISSIATGTMSDLSSLKRTALYLDQIVVSDPVFEQSRLFSEVDVSLAKFIGKKEENLIDRVSLSRAAQKLIDLRPFVVGGYVKLYPLSYHQERQGNVPFLYSNVGFEDALPKNLLKYYNRRAKVRTVNAVDGKLMVMEHLENCRQIDIQFEGMRGGFGMGYTLTSGEFEALDEDVNFLLKQNIPTTLPELDVFDGWVKQSINRTARNHFDDLQKRILLAEQLNCIFCCEYEFENNLLRTNPKNDKIPSNTLKSTLEIDVPYLDSVSVEDLMSLRNSDGEAFQNFRLEHERIVRSARHETSPEKVRAIVEDGHHELLEVQVKQLTPKIKSYRRIMSIEGIIGVAGLAASIPTGGVSVYVTVLAALAGCKSYLEYASKLKSNPCYFMWKVKKLTKTQ